MGWLEKHKEKKAEESYEKLYAAWQQQVADLEGCIQVASSFNGEQTDAILANPGELLFLQITNVSLIETRTAAGHYTGSSSGISVPIGHFDHSTIRYRVGANRGSYVQGQPYQAATDTGSAFVTNQRVIYVGSRQTRECDYKKLLAVSHDKIDGTTTFSVSNRQKPTTIHYGEAAAFTFVFKVSLALAHYKNTVPAFQQQLKASLATLNAAKPIDPEAIK